MSETAHTAIAVIGIDIGKNSFHVVGLGWSRRYRAETQRGDTLTVGPVFV